MHRCPPEVVHHIFRQLDFEEVSLLRLAGKKYADIGIEYLTNRIRFHCTEDSITRCKQLANHAVLRNHITSLVMEGNLLADVGCKHHFAAHFDLEHHSDEKPQPPDPHCTIRERRLYERNIAKYDRDMQQKYKKYRATWEKQQKLIKSPACAQVSRAVVLALPKLEHVTLSTIGGCPHALSRRFIQDFPLDCTMPMDQNSEQAALQLKYLILPTGQPLRNLKSLDVRVVSPAFFTEAPVTVLAEVFQTLQRVNLSFRLSWAERPDLDEDLKFCYEKKLGSRLNSALTAATSLKHLKIHFEDHGAMRPVVNLQTILGDSVWPSLESLDVNSVFGDEQYFSDALKRQPSLQHFDLAYAVLKSGTWPSLLESMTKLSLRSFTPVGVFEDPDEVYILDMVDADAWLGANKLEVRMADLVEWYVICDENSLDSNPLDSGITYADVDDLEEDYGDLSGDPDDEDDDTDSSMAEESNGDSDDVPDLEDMDVD